MQNPTNMPKASAVHSRWHVITAHGHIIERRPNNILLISRTDNKPITKEDAEEITRWYWLHVGKQSTTDDSHLFNPDASEPIEPRGNY